MSTPPLKILISGAGIAGSTLAYWLARARIRTSITIVERSPVPRVSGQSIDFRGPSVEIIKQMGLLDAINQSTTTEEGTRFVNAQGKTFAEFKTGAFTAEYEILRADLARLLLGACDRFEDIKCVYGDSIKTLEQDEKEVRVEFKGGSQQTYDLVVAADGAASKARRMILEPTVLSNMKEDFIGLYAAFFSAPRIPSDTQFWQICSKPKGLTMMVRPHRNPATVGVYLCICMPRNTRDPTVEEAINAGTDATKKMVREYFKDAGWQAQRLLDGMDAADDFYMSRSMHVQLPKWTHGRAAVLGDAAWATMGVATDLAIEGAYMLAGEISKVKSSADIPAALERYEQVFRPTYSKVEDMPPFFPQAMFPYSKFGLGVRDLAVTAISKTKAHRLMGLGGEQRTERELPRYDWIAV